jgi:hypothetical protein
MTVGHGGARGTMQKPEGVRPVTRVGPQGPMRPRSPERSGAAPTPSQASGAGRSLGQLPLVRRVLGDVLRRTRQRQDRTLRQVSADAKVSLGYLSEVERGQKEASSELLAAICVALDVPQSAVLREVSEELAAVEGLPTITGSTITGSTITGSTITGSTITGSVRSGEVVAAA